MKYLGIYNDMSGNDVETALNTLGELVNLGALDPTDDLSERQIAVANNVHQIWAEEQNR